MQPIRGLTVSVGYASLLEITLVRNLRHLTECLVITSADDVATHRVVESVPGARLHVTDAFTRYGARFNKGLAIEESFDVLGREGWILIWDADILLPDSVPMVKLELGKLHGAMRRILDDPSKWSPALEWRKCPFSRDGGPIGYFQLFHCDDPAIKDRRPWYEPTFTHAGGGDAYFLTHWHVNNFKMLPCEVLHIGPKDTHWFGTNSEARDFMAAYIVQNGWRRNPKVNYQAAEQIGEINERIEIPGHAPTGFELPFVAKARQDKARQRR